MADPIFETTIPLYSSAGEGLPREWECDVAYAFHLGDVARLRPLDDDEATDGGRTVVMFRDGEGAKVNSEYAAVLAAWRAYLKAADAAPPLFSAS